MLSRPVEPAAAGALDVSADRSKLSEGPRDGFFISGLPFKDGDKVVSSGRSGCGVDLPAFGAPADSRGVLAECRGVLTDCRGMLADCRGVPPCGIVARRSLDFKFTG